jgi:hypothetical protein
MSLLTCEHTPIPGCTLGDGIKKDVGPGGDGLKKDGLTTGDGLKKDGIATGDGLKDGITTGDGLKKKDGITTGDGLKKDGKKLADSQAGKPDTWGRIIGGGCDCRVGATEDIDTLGLLLIGLGIAHLAGSRRRRS